MNFQAVDLGLRTERSQTEFNMDTLKLKKEKKKVLLLQQQHDVNTWLFRREGRPTNGLRRCYTDVWARAVGFQAEQLATHCSEGTEPWGKSCRLPFTNTLSPKQKQNH